MLEKPCWTGGPRGREWESPAGSQSWLRSSKFTYRTFQWNQIESEHRVWHRGEKAGRALRRGTRPFQRSLSSVQKASPHLPGDQLPATWQEPNASDLQVCWALQMAGTSRIKHYPTFLLVWGACSEIHPKLNFLFALHVDQLNRDIIALLMSLNVTSL